MPDASRHPTAFISWAHADPDWDEAAVAARQDAVLRLSAALREAGIDVELDLHHLSESVDWTRWGPARAGESDFVLVVASQRWRSAWEGNGDPTKGAGSAAEADALRSLYNRNRDDYLNKIRIVMLPGATDHDIPDGLHGTPRFPIRTFDAAGTEELVRSLTVQAKFPKAPLGPLPVLPPTPPATDPADERARLQSALGALPIPTAQDPPELPWDREREWTENRLHDLDAAQPPPAADEAGDGFKYGPLPGPRPGRVESRIRSLTRQPRRAYCPRAAGPGSYVARASARDRREHFARQGAGTGAARPHDRSRRQRHRPRRRRRARRAVRLQPRPPAARPAGRASRGRRAGLRVDHPARR